MKRFKKILSLAITLSMIFSVMQIPTKAAMVSGAEKAKISLVALNQTSVDDDTYEITDAENLNLSDATVGDSFFLGIKVSNFDKIEEYANSHLGITGLSYGFVYDKRYIQPVTPTSKGFLDDLEYHKGLTYMNGKRPVTYYFYRNSEGYTYSLGDSGLQDCDGSKDTDTTNKQVAFVSLAWGGINDGKVTDYILPTDEIMAIMEFSLVAKPTPGTKVLSFSENNGLYSCDFGIATQSGFRQYQLTGSPTAAANPSDASDILNIIQYDTTGVDNLFPASATDYLDTLTVKTAATKNLNSYVEANKFDPTGLVLTPHKTESGNLADITGFTATNYVASPGAASGDGTLKFYIDAAGKTADTLVTTREITASTALATTDSGNHMYALYTIGSKKAIADLGEITVSAKSVSSIELVTSGSNKTDFTNTSNKYYTTDSIDAKAKAAASKIRIQINYDNNTNAGANYPFSTSAPYPYSLYRVDASGKLELVTTTTTFNAGTNTFYVAENGKAGSDPSSVTLKTAAFTATGIANVLQIERTVTAPDAALFYDVNANIDFSNVELSVKQASDSSYTTKKVSAIGASNLKFYYADTNTSAAYDASKAVPATYTAALNGKHVFVVPADDTNATPVYVGQLGTDGVKTITSINNLDPAAFSDGDKLGDAMTLTVTYKSGKTTDTTLTYNDFAGAGITMKIDGTAVDKDRVITVADKNKTIDFFIGDATTPAKSTAAIAMGLKAVNVIIDGTPSIAKTYDGDADFDADDTISVKVKKADLSTADQTTYENIVIKGLTFAYEDKNVGTTKKIVVTGTPTVDDATFKANYSLKLSTDNFETANGVTTVKNVTGAISAKALNVTAISGITTKMNPDATADVDVTGTADQTKFTSADLVAGDKVTISYSAKFAANDVKTAGNKTLQNVSFTITGGDDKDNYSVGTAAAEGSVSDRTLQSIAVDTTNAKLTYTYPDLTPDFSGVVVTATYDNGTADVSSKVTYSVAATDTLGYGDTEVTVTYTEGGVTKTATFTVTAKKKPINLSDIAFTATKVFGDDDSLTTTATINTGLEAGDIGENAAQEKLVSVSADFAFEDEAVGDNKKVTVSNISLLGDKAGNYVIVDENGDPITAATTVEITGSITAADQPAPAKPVLEIDKTTNDIVVTGPLGDNIEYSIDGGENWVTSPRFTGLDRDTTYNVIARVAASGSYDASEPSEATSIKTFKNFVKVFRSKADIATATPVSYGYTDTETAASVADINAIFTGADGNKNNYTSSNLYTDSAAKTKVSYSYSIAEDTILYYKAADNGSSGSRASTVTVSLSKTSIKDVVGSKVKVDATVLGSTAIPKWTSNNTKVATVDEDGNITLVGVGTTTIRATVGGVSKTVEVVVTEPEATPEPTTPVIKKDYKRPYASGYDEEDFRPNNAITRAELATMIARLGYGDELPDGVYDASFWDVPEDAWYNKYIGYLENLHVIDGYEDGDFRPDNLISRSEMCAVIARAQRFDIIPYTGTFVDVTENDWAKDYIQTLASMNIVTGYEDNSFGPSNSLTRAEAVTIINRLLDPSKAIVTFTPWDISGHWAEDAIMLAVNEREIIGEEPVETAAPEATEAPEETAEPEATAAPEETVDPEATAAPTETPDEK